MGLRPTHLGYALRLDKVLNSINEDMRDHTDTSFRLVLRDLPPNEADLTRALVPINPIRDPGPVSQGLSSSRMRFDAAALRATAT